MQNADMFSFWKTTGFFEDTVVQGVKDMLYGSTRFSPEWQHVIAAFMVMVVIGNVIYGLFFFFRKKFDLDALRQPIFVAGAVLMVTALGSIAQSVLMKTPYLTGRIAVFFFPLFIVSLVATLGLYHSQSARIPKIIVSLLVSFLLLIQIADTMKLDYVREWWYDSKTLEVIDYLRNTAGTDTVTLKANWLLHPSLYYYRFSGRMPNIILKDYDQKIDTNTRADYYYILKEDYGILESRFRPVILLDNRFLLVRRKEGPK